MDGEMNHLFTSLLCALCEKAWEEVALSPEHIIPESLGGRLTVEGFICESCNNKSGGSWDKELASQLQCFSALLGVKRQKGKIPFFDFEAENGRAVRLEADGTLSYTGKSSVTESIDRARGVGNVSIKARTIDQAEKIFENLRNKYIKDGAKKIDFKVEDNQEDFRQPININMSFGGELAGKSLVKSAWALAAYCKLEPFECENVFDYLVKNARICYGYYYSSDLVSERPSNILHCVSIKGIPSKGLLLAYVEYFSVLRVVVCLSNKYTGKEFNYTYALNPVSGERYDIDVNLDFDAEDIERIYDYQFYDVEVLKTCLVQISLLSYQRSVKLNLERKFEKTAKELCLEFGYDEDQDLTDEQYKVFCNRFIELILPYYTKEILPMRQIISTEKVRKESGDN